MFFEFLFSIYLFLKSFQVRVLSTKTPRNLMDFHSSFHGYRLSSYKGKSSFSVLSIEYRVLNILLFSFNLQKVYLRSITG